ncbi:hypothetical protein MCGE09_00192 [Thaumarchaeota archaeon SCGC AB-539-E09]|nr:hypothetical protein MCGE09_00192 [Thaumarchaeota archaeon SCGC AB-539-E09]
MLNRALKLQREGKQGSAQKPIADVHDRIVKLMEKATGKKYLAWEEHEQDAERRLETKRLKYEKTVKEAENVVLRHEEKGDDVVERNERLEDVVSIRDGLREHHRPTPPHQAGIRG